MESEKKVRKVKNILINPCFKEAITSRRRYKRLQGGAGSGKSIATAKLILWRIMEKPGQRAFCFRKIRARVKHSIFSTFNDLLAEADMTRFWDINKSDLSFTYRPTGSEIICGGLDDEVKIKSIKDPTIIWMEEATEFVENDFIQLDLRLRKQNAQLEFFLTYNPVSKNNWVYKAFEVDRQFSGNEVFISTTYRDNPYLDANYKAMLAGLESRSYEHYKVYALGEWGEISRGLVFPDYEVVEEWPDVATVFGLDFGYNDPMALVEVAITADAFYARELFYASEVTVPDLLPRFPGFGIGPKDDVYCDSASPGSIQILYNGVDGVRYRGVKPAIKGADSIVAGISLLKSRPLRILAGSTNLIYELDRYTWDFDKEGELVEGKPVDAFNHAIDATRYAVFTHLYKPQAQGSRAMSTKRKVRYRR